MACEKVSVSNPFQRFPHTPHLAWLGPGAPRDDKVLSSTEARALLGAEVVVEEKLDGANLGISVGLDGFLKLQSRGQYLVAPYGGQFSRAGGWLAQHGHSLVPALGSELILFGEWCAARHSIGYEQLADWFFAFDVYDRAVGQFWSTRRRDELVVKLGLKLVPQLARRKMTLEELRNLILSGRSRYGTASMEGVVVRREGHDFLENRAKLVHPDFVQSIDEHWRRRRIEWNSISN